MLTRLPSLFLPSSWMVHSRGRQEEWGQSSQHLFNKTDYNVLFSMRARVGLLSFLLNFMFFYSPVPLYLLCNRSVNCRTTEMCVDRCAATTRAKCIRGSAASRMKVIEDCNQWKPVSCLVHSYNGVHLSNLMMRSVILSQRMICERIAEFGHWYLWKYSLV